MNSQNINQTNSHNISIRDRKHIDISGVKEVVSFDDTSVVMVTVGGDMTVEGDNLKIGVLDTDRGLVSIDGKISALLYEDESSTDGKKGILGKIFRS